MPDKTQIKDRLETIFRAGLKAVDPARLIAETLFVKNEELTVNHPDLNLKLNLKDFDEIVVLGCGKAAAPMAKAVEKLLGPRITRGVVVVKYGYTVNLAKIELLEAGHPMPDVNGIAASVKIMQTAQSVTNKSLVIMLTTGGGSALLPAPAPGLNLDDVQKTTALLLESGADINAMNCVRKHLSAIKGGRLAKLMQGATVLNLLLSDVAGDDLGAIASGPCAPDFTSYNDGKMLLTAYNIWNKVPAAVRDYIEKGVNGQAPETPDFNDPCFTKVHQLVLAGNSRCVDGCHAKAREMGYNVKILPRFYTGEAKEVGRSLYALAVDMAKNTPQSEKPLCFVAGGEATVTLPEKYGKGGRTMELALSFLQQTIKHETGGIFMLAGATDGSDGPTDSAGAFVTPDVLDAIMLKDMNAETALKHHDSYPFFSRAGGLLKTGPTNTNVCDVGIIIIF